MMKTLQNNFTTPDQSKQLLELGVPAETADCVLENLDTAENDFAAKDYTRWIIEERHVKADIFTDNNKGIFLPCWSVGRLIDISRIFSTLPDEEWMFPFWRDQEDNIEWSIRVIESGIRTGNMDFSKLDD